MSKTTIEAQIEEVNARADRFTKHFKVKENGHLQTDYHGLMEFVKKEVELALTTQREELVKLVESKKQEALNENHYGYIHCKAVLGKEQADVWLYEQKAKNQVLDELISSLTHLQN